MSTIFAGYRGTGGRSGPPAPGNISRRPTKQRHDVAPCESCGKKAELEKGLCPDCKWKIDNKLIRPVERKKDRSFWSFMRRSRRSPSVKSSNI